MAVYLIAALVLLGVVLVWARIDYLNWVAIGKGGLPHTLGGWLKMTRLRLQKTDTIGVHIYAPMIGKPDDVARLGDLPARQGSRPRIAVYPIPHRQLDQAPSADTRGLQDALFDAYVEQRSQFVCYQTSHYERHNNAVFVRPDHIHAAFGHISGGEVAHVHQSDGSMHMIFSPSDCKTVIEKGWGERHPLTGVYPGLPLTYLMIYAPRNADEVKVVQQFLRAAISNVCLCDVAPPRLGPKP